MNHEGFDIVFFCIKLLLFWDCWNEGNFLFLTKHSKFMAAIGCSPLRSPEGVECCPGLAVGLTHYQLTVSLLCLCPNHFTAPLVSSETSG